MEYALIENGIVENIICLHPMNADEFPNAVPFSDLPVEIGDTYNDGKFYRNGEEALPYSFITAAEVAAIKDQAIAEIEEAVINGIDE